MHIIDLTHKDNPTILLTHHFNTVGDGPITDVETCSDTVAVAIGSNTVTAHGHVELFLPFTHFDSQLTKIGRVPAGHTPKDMAFTSDCSRLIVANEGKPGLLHNTFEDPRGSISVIIKNDQGFPPEVNTNFDSFNDRVNEYIRNGVRYIFRGDQSANVETTFSKDLEPESVAIDQDDRYAYISLQENNAVVKFDITQNRIIEIYALGVKNWTNFDMDASDRDGGPNLKRHHIFSFYQPRDIKIGVVNGQSYLFTANTGAIKKLTQQNEGFDFTDAARARTLHNNGAIDEVLVGADNKAKINNDADLGRLHVSGMDGLNSQGLIQYIHAYGSRSVSMWNTATFQRVYDTGDDMEREAINKYSSTFNGDCENINLSPAGEMDLRSDDYGVEPTAVAFGTHSGAPLIVTASRSGMIYVFNVIGTALSFQSVHRRGGTNQAWNLLYQNNSTGDCLISDIGYVDESALPDRTGLVYVIGSGSSSVSLYEIYDNGITKK
ncbi:mesenchyme-specific cell surface glycoprotein-like [Mytilus californianus]|uniref:mesenchyme-specific cell surface glycoprotein-like n=1 Tax=Mytilus californianus TaxID=6549 RepID=UPI0022456AAC|nr:mesenchyme-specific cell surface glycoprotein-like [Mytilus californianus]